MKQLVHATIHALMLGIDSLLPLPSLPLLSIPFRIHGSRRGVGCVCLVCGGVGWLAFVCLILPHVAAALNQQVFVCPINKHPFCFSLASPVRAFALLVAAQPWKRRATKDLVR